MNARFLATVVLALALGPAHAQQIPAGEPEPEVLQAVGHGIFRVKPVNTPYERWFAKARQHMPTFEGMAIDNVASAPLLPWDQVGVDGLYIKMADYQITDGWILEIPPHGKTRPMRHMFEAGMYFFDGPGRVVIQQEGKQPEAVPFGKHTLFSIPLNVQYQLFNDSEQPVRLLAVTSFPFVINATDNVDFAFDNPFGFRDRYDAGEDFSTRSEHVYQNQTITNLVENALEFELDEYDRRGKDSTNMHWDMSGNTMLELHVSEIPPGRYKKAHRHSSDAFILLLSGQGYSLAWPGDGFDERVRVDWQAGTLFVPPMYWYHQHLNPGTEPARYLAINAPNLVTNLGLRFEDQLETDPPELQAEFEAAIEQHKQSERQ